MMDLSVWVEVFRLFMQIMVSFAFFMGIILLVSPEAFNMLNQTLSREYGLKKRIIPQLEDKKIDALDRFILQNRILSGAFISVSSFLLLVFPK